MPLPIRFYAGQDNEDTADYESSFELDDPETNLERIYVLSRMSTLSAEQEEKVEELIKEIRPEIPLFVAIMKPSNVKSHNPSLVSCTVLFGQFTSWSNPVIALFLEINMNFYWYIYMTKTR